MSAQTPDPRGALEPYQCSQIVYRAIIYNDWWRPSRTKVRKNAFYRLGKDIDGLSVNPHPGYASRYIKIEIFGFVKLHVGRVRDLGLDVIPDRIDHANIVGVPTREENRDESMRLADLLAELARPVTEEELTELLRNIPPAS
jgi:hypothetical protein